VAVAPGHGGHYCPLLRALPARLLRMALSPNGWSRRWVIHPCCGICLRRLRCTFVPRAAGPHGCIAGGRTDPSPQLCAWPEPSPHTCGHSLGHPLRCRHIPGAGGSHLGCGPSFSVVMCCCLPTACNRVCVWPVACTVCCGAVFPPHAGWGFVPALWAHFAACVGLLVPQAAHSGHTSLRVLCTSCCLHHVVLPRACTLVNMGSQSPMPRVFGLGVCAMVPPCCSAWHLQVCGAPLTVQGNVNCIAPGIAHCPCLPLGVASVVVAHTGGWPTLVGLSRLWCGAHTVCGPQLGVVSPPSVVGPHTWCGPPHCGAPSHLHYVSWWLCDVLQHLPMTPVPDRRLHLHCVANALLTPTVT